MRSTVLSGWNGHKSGGGGPRREYTFYIDGARARERSVLSPPVSTADLWPTVTEHLNVEQWSELREGQKVTLMRCTASSSINFYVVWCKSKRFLRLNTFKRESI